MSLYDANYTGDSSYWRGLLYGLSLIQPRVNFLLCFNGDPPQNIPKSDHFQVISAPKVSSRMWSLLRFPLLGRRHGAQLYHSQYNLSPLIVRRGITTIHDVSFFVEPSWFQPKDLFVLQKFVPKTAEKCRAVITVSETSQTEIEKFIPASQGKVHVTYNALDPEFVAPPAAEARKVIRERFGVENYALTVGTRWPRKNTRLAIEAVDRSSQLKSLVVMGKYGWGEEAQSKKAILTGFVDLETKLQLYAAAKMYLAPSLHEGFGIPLLEAWASGIPVICYAGGALPEIAGDAAIVMTSTEPTDWGNQIDALARDQELRLELIRKGTQRLQTFSWKDTAEKTVAIYRKSLGLSD